MKLLIVAATFSELAPYYQAFNLPHQNFVETSDFDILITGVGMVATAFAMGRLAKGEYSLALNVGIAGAFDRNLVLGEVVYVTDDRMAELGAEDHGRFMSIEELGFGKSRFRSTSDLRLNLKEVHSITMNKVHGNAESIEKTKALFDPQIESMEGGAFFYACEQLALPSLQVRSISNYVEPRNRNAWQIGLAVKNLNDWLLVFLEQLKQ